MRLLRQLGLRVEMPLGLPNDAVRPLRRCGRPLISNGLLTQAVANARQNVQRLFSWADSGGRIVACEPSCLLTLKDDYPALLRGEERRQAAVVAAACLTWEELLEARLTEHPAPLRFRAGPRAILVQGHCHQRLLVGMKPTMQLLRRIPGAQVVDLDAGCCGLAGSFGYEKEHYEVSRLVGEQRLFPRPAPGRAGRGRRRSGFFLPAAKSAFHRPTGAASRRTAGVPAEPS